MSAIRRERQGHDIVGMTQKRLDRGTARRVPDLDGRVVNGRGERLPVRRERHPVDITFVGLDLAKLTAAGHIPETHRPVAAATREHLAVGGELDMQDIACLPACSVPAKRSRLALK